MLFSTNSAVEQVLSSHRGRHGDCAFLFTRFWCTRTHVRSKPSATLR